MWIQVECLVNTRVYIHTHTLNQLTSAASTPNTMCVKLTPALTLFYWYVSRLCSCSRQRILHVALSCQFLKLIAHRIGPEYYVGVYCFLKYLHPFQFRCPPWGNPFYMSLEALSRFSWSVIVYIAEILLYNDSQVVACHPAKLIQAI